MELTSSISRLTTSLSHSGSSSRPLWDMCRFTREGKGGPVSLGDSGGWGAWCIQLVSRSKSLRCGRLASWKGNCSSWLWERDSIRSAVRVDQQLGTLVRPTIEALSVRSEGKSRTRRTLAPSSGFCETSSRVSSRKLVMPLGSERSVLFLSTRRCICVQLCSELGRRTSLLWER